MSSWTVGKLRPKILQYEAFELLFRDEGARGIEVSVPQVPGAPRVTIDRRTLERLEEAGLGRSGLGRPPVRHVRPDGALEPESLQRDLAWAKQIGGALFEATFRGNVGRAFTAARSRLRGAGKGLSLRLRMPALPKVPLLPWELLYDTECREFLADDAEVSIVRAPEAWKPEPVSQLRLPMRILAIASSPAGFPELDVEGELGNIKQAIGWSLWRAWLSRERHATFAKLRRRFESRQRIDVLHVIGHGEQRGSEGPALVVEDAEGKPDVVAGEQLKLLMGSKKGLRLVVLNACESGSSPPGDALAGLASRLVSGGVPAVVAMREPISDDAALFFAGRFYRVLARTGAIEAAVAAARREVHLAPVEALEWSVPTLYLRSEGSRLFEPSLRWLKVASSAAAAALLASVAFWAGQRGPEPPPDGSGAEPPQLASLPSGVEPCPGPPGLDLVLIQPGTFQMGWENGGDKNERPVHEVALTKPYCIARIEITNKLWGEVMGERVAPDIAYVPKSGSSWNDARRFVEALEKRYPGFNFRLPTEAEWEYAARAGQPTRFSFGDDPSLLPEHGNCESEGNRDGYDGVARVGSYKPNPWGLYDMHGNVFEWVADWHADYTAERGRDPEGPPKGMKRIRRGGSFKSKPESCSATARSDVLGGRRQQATGLRLVMEPPASVPAPSPAP